MTHEGIDCVFVAEMPERGRNIQVARIPAAWLDWCFLGNANGVARKIDPASDAPALDAPTGAFPKASQPARKMCIEESDGEAYAKVSIVLKYETSAIPIDSWIILEIVASQIARWILIAECIHHCGRNRCVLVFALPFGSTTFRSCIEQSIDA